MIAEARENLAESDLAVRFSQIDIQAIPFATASFDVVIANYGGLLIF